MADAQNFEKVGALHWNSMEKMSNLGPMNTGAVRAPEETPQVPFGLWSERLF
jgi:hypothetical protein